MQNKECSDQLLVTQFPSHVTNSPPGVVSALQILGTPGQIISVGISPHYQIGSLVLGLMSCGNQIKCLKYFLIKAYYPL